MATKGTIAKENIFKKLKEVYGKDFIGEVDKKLYLWVDDGGEKVQIAISMTCPKTYVENGNISTPTPAPIPTRAAPWDTAPAEPVKISTDEMKNIEELMAKFGL